MTWFFPWMLIFFLLFFFGIFFMIWFSTKTQEKILAAILQQSKATRLELERLGRALDNLLSDREVIDDEILAADKESADPAKSVPGVDRLLLGDEKAAAPPKPAKTSSLPEL